MVKETIRKILADNSDIKISQNSSVSKVSGYGSDDWGSQQGFSLHHQSRLALGPNQPPVQWGSISNTKVKKMWRLISTPP
jgi:hypothetical protein